MDATGLGAMFGGMGTLLGSVGGVVASRVTCARHLARCEDRLTDAETIIGVLLSILPGGELAHRFNLYRRARDQEVAAILNHTRVRWRQRHGLAG